MARNHPQNHGPIPPRRVIQGRSNALSIAVTCGLVVLIAASISCAAMEPALTNWLGSSPTPQESKSWSLVEIAKPTPTPVWPTATSMPTAEVPAPEIVATATPDEHPVITMVIVEDESLPAVVDQPPEAANPGGKYVLVSISEQHLYAYENGQLVYSFVASTGMGNSTRAGSFRILDKIPSAYGANWNIWMPNWMGIYWSGTLENGIHALPILPGGSRLWAGFLGTPISYGCVVLGADEAMQLYEWADIGTPVDIRW